MKVSNFNLVSRCLKIIEKVAFNIASEASYVYIFQNGQIVLPDRTKIDEKCRNETFWMIFKQCDIGKNSQF